MIRIFKSSDSKQVYIETVTFGSPEDFSYTRNGDLFTIDRVNTSVVEVNDAEYTIFRDAANQPFPDAATFEAYLILILQVETLVTTDDLPNVQDGDSAYDIWLAEGNTGTEQDFLNSLVGPTGPQGQQGNPGADSTVPGPQGPIGPQGNPGNDGQDGNDGLSAYQVWLNLGNTGTEVDFINSLTGPQGPAGNDGQDGVDGQDGATGPQGPPGDNYVEEFLECTLASNQQLPAGTGYQNIDSFDTPTLNTLTGGTFNASTGLFTCTETGIYRFDFQTTLDQYDGNNRTSSRVRLTLNGSLVKGTEQIGYHRQNLHGFNNYSFTKSLSLIPGNTVRVQARNEDGSRDHQLLANSTLFRITKIKQ